MPTVCNLCKREQEPRNSHMIPEFLHRPVYDPKHRAAIVERGTGTVRTVRQGYRERLLCQDCEQYLGRLDRSFSQTWYGRGALPERVPGRYVRISGLLYEDFKLFHLSVLWRASVAQGKLFALVDLELHEERLRRILLEWTLPPPGIYPVYGMVLRHPDGHLVAHEMVGPPGTGPMDGVRYYSFAWGHHRHAGFGLHAVPLPRAVRGRLAASAAEAARGRNHDACGHCVRA